MLLGEMKIVALGSGYGERFCSFEGKEVTLYMYMDPPSPLPVCKFMCVQYVLLQLSVSSSSVVSVLSHCALRVHTLKGRINNMLLHSCAADKWHSE